MKISTVALVALVVVSAPVRAGQFELLSEAATESDTADGREIFELDFVRRPPVLSNDGRWIAFHSSAVNLVLGEDRNSGFDVFLHDRLTGTNILVSHAAGAPATASDGHSSRPSLSADGRWVAYTSDAGNLVSGQMPGPSPRVYLFDRETGTNTLVSHFSQDAAISADGSWIAFESRASDLVPGLVKTFPEGRDTFLYERATGQIRLVSRVPGTATTTTGALEAAEPSISSDGRYVAFSGGLFDRVTGTVNPNGGGRKPSVSSDGAFVAFLRSGNDVFLFNRAAGTTVQIGTGVNSAPQPPPRISADGAYVAFESSTNNERDVFLYERATASLTLVSRSAASPSQTGDRGGESPWLSSDGRFVVFASRSRDLVPGQIDANSDQRDVFLFDRTTGATSLLSGAGGSGQVTGNWDSLLPAISADGLHVAFQTRSRDLVPGVADLNFTLDVVLHDRIAGTSAVATLHAPGMGSATAGAASYPVSVSADGRYAVFLSSAENVVPGQVDPNLGPDVFLADRATGTRTLVSRSAGSATTAGNVDSTHAAISADGAYVVFTSRATDLVPGQVDTNRGIGSWAPAGEDVFLYDRAAGTTTLVSHAAGSVTTAGNGVCHFVHEFATGPAISADGRWVAFACSSTNLVPGQIETNGSMDVFLYDRVSGQTVLVSRSTASATTAGNHSSWNPVLSRDGRYVAFVSEANNLMPGTTDPYRTQDVFLYDRISGQMRLVSRAAGTAATAANDDSGNGRTSISGDGRYIAFMSLGTNLVTGQNDNHSVSGEPTNDVFFFDRNTGIVELISRVNGTATTTSGWDSSYPTTSDDGRYVAFWSEGSNYVHDRTLRTMEALDRSVPAFCDEPTLTPDGRHAAFFCGGPDPDSSDLFLYDNRTRSLERVAQGSWQSVYDFYGFSSTDPFVPLLSDDGSVALFTSRDPDLAPDDHNGDDDLFAYVKTPPAAGDFFTVTPCRLLDTRLPQDGPALASGTPATLDAAGACGIPQSATAVAINVAVIQPTAPGRLTVHPGNLATSTSTVDFTAGQTRSNNAILALALNGEGTLGLTPVLDGGGTVHVILDVVGWFE